MNNFKILITGGAGFIPSNLAKTLISKGATVVLADNMITGKQENIPNHKNCTFHKIDVNNFEELENVFTGNNFNYVFHFAALVGVQRTLNNPLMVLEDIQGFKNVLSLSKKNNVKKVFFSSSSEVYGEPVFLPQHEDKTPLNARLPYAVVKNVGEVYLKSFQQEFGLDFSIFRFFNTYGPNQSEDFVMSKFIKAALNGNDITIYGDGSQTRTFCYIDDNIDSCILAMNSEIAHNSVINIGNDKITTIKELAETIIRLTNSSSKIVYLPALEDGDMTRRQPDISKMKLILKRELIPLEDGIKLILNYNDK